MYLTPAFPTMLSLKDEPEENWCNSIITRKHIFLESISLMTEANILLGISYGLWDQDN